MNIVQNRPEVLEMQSLACDFANTFVDDAAALVGGCGRIVVRIVTAPIERLANACDVAGVLPARRSRLHMLRAGTKAASTAPRHGQRRKCIFSFRFLSDLT